MLSELQVIRSTRQYLKQQGLGQWKFNELFSDPHPTLINDSTLAPFQRFTLDFDQFQVHPDIVGQLSDGERVIAVEAKGQGSLLKGLAQAEIYQAGFHATILAAPATSLGEKFVNYAADKGVAVLSIGPEPKLLNQPTFKLPQLDLAQSVKRQLHGLRAVNSHKRFVYNLPSHYLIWPSILSPNCNVNFEDLPKLWQNYPMPKHFRAALSGSEALGLIKIDGRTVRLTDTGDVAKTLLPPLSKWPQIHNKLKNKHCLTQVHKQAAALLKLILLNDPVVKLLATALRTFPDQSASFRSLFARCSELDKILAPIFFLNPNAPVRLASSTGKINPSKLKGQDCRSTSFYQFKSLLKHAGILSPETKLGKNTSKSYCPDSDIWSLANESRKN